MFLGLIMTDESYVETWKSQTTAFDRVQSVTLCLSEAKPAGWIAEDAHVAENTARSHLSRLDDLGILQTDSRDGVTVYYPDPLYTRMRTLRDLLDEYDRDGLIDLRATLQERIEELQTEYDVASPDGLRCWAGQTETATETREFKKTASDWELLQYRLSVVSEAIENYTLYASAPERLEDDNATSSLPEDLHERASTDEFYKQVGEQVESGLSRE